MATDGERLNAIVDDYIDRERELIDAAVKYIKLRDSLCDPYKAPEQRHRSQAGVNLNIAVSKYLDAKSLYDKQFSSSEG